MRVSLPCAEVVTSNKIWPLEGKDALVSQAKPNQVQRGSVTHECVNHGKAINSLGWLGLVG